MLAEYRNEPYTKTLTELVNTYKPEILLLGATNLGRDLAGSVATTLLTGLTADCTELAVDADKSLAATRPTFGGSLLCTIYTLNFRPQMATVRPRVMAMPARQEGPHRPRRRARDRPRGGEHRHQGAVVPARPLVAEIEPRLRRRRRRRRPRAAERREPAARARARGRARRRVGLLAPLRAEGLGAGGAADRPDRQDDPAEALHRRRHLGRDPASRRRRGRRPDRRDQHRPQRADPRFRPSTRSRPTRSASCRR